MFDQLDLVTYEEVVKLPAFKRKTLVLLGVYVDLALISHLTFVSWYDVSYVCGLLNWQVPMVLAEDTSRTHSSPNTQTDLLTPFHVSNIPIYQTVHMSAHC